jgi:hypothetical protein
MGIMLPLAEYAYVDQSKIVDYLLSVTHPDGQAKARFFVSFGFHVNQWKQLADALCSVGTSNPVSASVESSVMSEIKEHQRIVLTTDLPAERLTVGDVGTVVHVYQGGSAFEVEFSTLTGETVAVVSLEKTQLRTVDNREVTHARRVA